MASARPVAALQPENEDNQTILSQREALKYFRAGLSSSLNSELMTFIPALSLPQKSFPFVIKYIIIKLADFVALWFLSHPLSTYIHFFLPTPLHHIIFNSQTHIWYKLFGEFLKQENAGLSCLSTWKILGTGPNSDKLHIQSCLVETLPATSLEYLWNDHSTLNLPISK